MREETVGRALIARVVDLNHIAEFDESSHRSWLARIMLESDRHRQFVYAGDKSGRERKGLAITPCCLRRISEQARILRWLHHNRGSVPAMVRFLSIPTHALKIGLE